MYDYVFFDWDGCIADTLDSWITVCQQALREQHIVASREEIWQEFCGGSVPRHFDVKDMDQWRKDVGVFGREAFRTVPLYDGAAEIIRRLAQTKRLALITDSRRSFIHPSLIYRELYKCFQLIITEEDVPHKPDAGGITATVTRFRARPERCVMVGDSRKDLQAARNAGIDAILFYPPSHQVRYRLADLLDHEPKHVVTSFTELPRLIA